MTAAAIVAVAIGVTACGSSSKPAVTKTTAHQHAATTTSQSKAARAISVAMAIPGPIDDKSFDEMGYEGLQECKANGARTTYKAEVATPEFSRVLQTFARSSEVVIGDGEEFAEVTEKLAPEFPQTKFIVAADPIKPHHSNVEALEPNSTQSAYLAGVVAGEATKTNKLGGVGGFEFPVLRAQMQAFEAGAKAVNPKATMKVVYLGSFEDAAKGREAATSLAASGVDVVYHIADNAGVGVIDGAQASGIKAIGWGKNQHALAPNTVIASQIVNLAAMIKSACSAIAAGKFEGGGVVMAGLESGVVGLSPIYNEPSSIQATVESYRKKILAGSVSVPSIGGGIPASGPKSD